jgi:hypothetical protein
MVQDSGNKWLKYLLFAAFILSVAVAALWHGVYRP